MRINVYCILFLISLTKVSAQTPCENGFAGTYPCNQINLLSHLTPNDLSATLVRGYYANDVWGWTDPLDQTEYAILGLTDGVAFIDLSDPTSPQYIAKLEESPGSASDRVSHEEKSTWRDIKVFKNHAFVVSDLNKSHGMQVFDLTKLRGLSASDFQVFQADTIYNRIGSAHNIAINEQTGFAYIVGISSGGDYCFEGGLHILDVNDPQIPKYVGCFDNDGYTHDAQCVIYNGPDDAYTGREICFNANEDTFTIVDVDSKDEMSLISRTSYDDVFYSHQGWLTEDHRFFLMNDELDEQARKYNPRTLIWDIQDLNKPVLIGQYFNEQTGIDHNLYTHNGMAFESNYRSGLRVISLDSIETGQLRELAFFDTHPEDNDIEYGGTWSNYPYFESEIVVVSDMNEGLFVLELDLKADPTEKHPKDTATCEGKEVSFNIEANEQNLTYQWQYRPDSTSFRDFIDGENTSGSNSTNLSLTASKEMAELPIRCKLTSESGNVFYTYPAKISFTGELPDVDFAFTTSGLTYSFENKSSNANSYLWDFGDGTSSDAINPSHEYMTTGNYEIKLKAFNGCGSDSVFLIQNVQALGFDSPKNLKIYPNPGNGLITIDFESKTIDLEVLELTGKIVSSKKSINRNSIIDLSFLKPGTYLMKATDSSTIRTTKLIIR